MIAFPGCKINLGLNITHKLSNGYHELESVFVPVLLSDVLEMIESPTSDETEFNYSGLTIPGDPSNNLIKKAFDLLSQNYKLPPVQVHLHKIVPMGAGLGGGSADASAMLMILNSMFKLKISQAELIDLAKTIGADCPFFILNKPALVTGVGENIKPIDPGLKGKKIFLVFPDIHVNTSEAFQNIIPKQPIENLKSIIQNYPIVEWKNHLKNDFEDYVFNSHPEIAKIKKQLYDMGAIYASLSGSGSTVYGIFNDAKEAFRGDFKKYFTYLGDL
jgi:4-diphosphocytidyl-2-C-methyl-D-erythritol kinase